jgi:hypothetical protein
MAALRTPRRIAGALLYDLLRFERRLRAGRWTEIRNRDEAIDVRERGVRCAWQFTSEIHIANVFPSFAARLMQAGFAEWPVHVATEGAAATETPDVSFIVGHRGTSRLPHLLATLRTIAAQTARVECIVVEQSLAPEIHDRLPSWVRYLHTPIPHAGYDYNRAWTLNAGARIARGEALILHDNDILVPAAYAAEALRRLREGWDFADLKRFTFYLPEETTKRYFDGAPFRPVAATVVQNLQGASIVASRRAYLDVGGFDETFVGWGGEDNEFWERAEEAGRVWGWGYLPFAHLFHAAQKEKLRGSEAAGIQRWHEVSAVRPRERIERLRSRDFGRADRPVTA